MGLYSPSYTLRERVLNPIDRIRGVLCLAVSLIAAIDPTYGDAPLGIDSQSYANAIFVSGVFSRVALMVLLRSFEALVPRNFSVYHLAENLDPASQEARLFYPKTGFVDDTDAVWVTRVASLRLSAEHEKLAREITGKE